VPKIVLHDRHFSFLRKLLWDAIHHDVALDCPDVALAEELLVVFNYTRYFKLFAVEIAADNDS
jgi:hypothetical protein